VEASRDGRIFSGSKLNLPELLGFGATYLHSLVTLFDEAAAGAFSFDGTAEKKFNHAFYATRNWS
jgi:hypothetical protein